MPFNNAPVHANLPPVSKRLVVAWATGSAVQSSGFQTIAFFALLVLTAYVALSGVS